MRFTAIPAPALKGTAFRVQVLWGIAFPGSPLGGQPGAERSHLCQVGGGLARGWSRRPQGVVLAVLVRSPWPPRRRRQISTIMPLSFRTLCIDRRIAEAIDQVRQTRGLLVGDLVLIARGWGRVGTPSACCAAVRGTIRPRTVAVRSATGTGPTTGTGTTGSGSLWFPARGFTAVAVANGRHTFPS